MLNSELKETLDDFGDHLTVKILVEDEEFDRYYDVDTVDIDGRTGVLTLTRGANSERID